MTAERTPYRTRMLRALEYIDQHLDDPLTLDRVSGIAAFSRFHFHRQFTATFGVSVHRYIQLARMKRAAHRLAFRTHDRVTAIALEAGYDAPDAFARAFRRLFGQSPSAFRAKPDWAPWQNAFTPLDHARSQRMASPYANGDVVIRTTAAIPVAIMEHRGPAATLGATIQRFIAWRKANHLPPATSPTFTVWRGAQTGADCSMDLCVGTDRALASPDGTIRTGEIPGGRCAALRVTGHTDNLEPAALFLYRTWLPASGEELRDCPLYCQRLRFFPDVPEHAAVADLFLPLK